MKNRTKEMIEDSKKYDKYFFDEDTMNFWNSTIETDLTDNDLFITSEDNFNRTEKLYSIRQYDWESHSVKTISFQQFKTLEDAIKTMKQS